MNFANIMSNSQIPSDILSSYDFQKNKLLDNANRENLIQQVVVLLLNGIGYDFSLNAQTQIFLDKPSKTPQEILTSLLSNKDPRETIVIDRSTGKLTLINPNVPAGVGTITPLEQAQSTFSSGIVLGEQKLVPTQDTLHGISVSKTGTGSNQVITLRITQSDGSDLLLSTQVDITRIDALITAINSRIAAAEGKITALETTEAQHTTDIAGLKSTQTQHTTELATHDNTLNNHTAELQQHTNDIYAAKQDITTLNTVAIRNITSLSPEITVASPTSTTRTLTFNKQSVANSLVSSQAPQGLTVDHSGNLGIKISTTPGNTAQIGPDGGLAVTGGSGSSSTITVSAGKAIEITKNNNDYQVALHLSNAAGNSISVDSTGGVFAPPSQGGGTIVAQGDGILVSHAINTYTVSSHISSEANNALIIKPDKGLFVPTSSGGVSTTITSTDGTVQHTATGSSVDLSIAGTIGNGLLLTSDASKKLQVNISPKSGNQLSIDATNGNSLFVPASTGGGGVASIDDALDTIETIYVSSTGSNTNDGRTVSKPVVDISNAATKAMTLRDASSQNNYNPVHITGVPTETARNIIGNFEINDGQLFFNFPRSNAEGLVITQNITTASAPKLNTALCLFNNFHNSSHFIVKVNPTTDNSLIKDEFNIHISCNRLEIDSSSTQSFIQVLKGTGLGSTACVRALNIIIECDNLEEINSTLNDRAEPIVSFNQQDLAGLQTHVIFTNKTQDTSQVTQLATATQPFVITGTPDSTNPCSLFVTATLPENRSQLYNFQDGTSSYAGYNIRLQDKNILNTVVPKTFIIPSSSSTEKGSISINNDLVTYVTTGSSPIQKTVATQDYVREQINQSKTNQSITYRPAASFSGYIRIDPVSQTILTPNITFHTEGRDYSDQLSIDKYADVFTIQEEFFTFRLNDVTAGSTTLPKQLLLDQWDGVSAGQAKAFYGIGRIKLMDTTVTVTDNTANSTEIEYNIAFTSTLSLTELQANLLPGCWIELSNPADSKFVVGVISGTVSSGTGANNFIAKANIAFTNSKIQSSLYAVTDLANKALSIYLNPFPGVFPQEFKRFRAAVTNGDQAHVQMHYYISAYHSSDVIEEALLLTPYSPSYASYANRATDTDWDKNIGKYQFSIGNSIPKIIIEKFKTIWAESKIRVGHVPMPIPSFTKDTSPNGRSLIGIIIQDRGSNLSSSYIYSVNPTSPLYWNMPSYFSGLTGLSISGKRVNCGLQVSSFTDFVYMTIRLAFDKSVEPVQMFSSQGTIDQVGGTLSSYDSTAGFQENTASKCLVFDEYVNRNIAAYSLTDQTSSKPFPGVVGTNSKLDPLKLYILGWLAPNSVHSSIENHKIVRLSAPDTALPTPADDELLVIGNFTEAEAIGNKGYFIKADGTAIGHLASS